MAPNPLEAPVTTMVLDMTGCTFLPSRDAGQRVS
jgi:hypothetical protein